MENTRYWRLNLVCLEGTECKECGARYFPPRPICPDCLAGPVINEMAELTPGDVKEQMAVAGD